MTISTGSLPNTVHLYQVTLEEVERLRSSGKSEEAKRRLGQLIVEQHKDSSPGFEISKCFHLLAQICKESKAYLEASAITCYITCLENKFRKNCEASQNELKDIQRRFLKDIKNVETVEDILFQPELDKQKLAKIRENICHQYTLVDQRTKISDKVQKIHALYEQISQAMTSFIEGLIKESMNQLSQLGRVCPCQYAVVGLGSLSRKEMTPYSDLEFAVLIDSSEERHKDYFRTLTKLLHLRFICLGETIVPALNISALEGFYDQLTPRGLAFDGSMPTACKTPLGKQQGEKGDYELLGTPQELSALQDRSIDASEAEKIWALKKYHLPTILSNTSYLSGSEKGQQLFEDYRKRVKDFLKGGEGRRRAQWLMKDDLVRFSPKIDKESSGYTHDIKKDIYRFPNTMLDGLANYFGLNSSSGWDRIQELEKQQILSSKSAADVRALLMLAQELRLSTYLSHRGQIEQLVLNESNEKLLHQIYLRALSFKEAMEEVFKKFEGSEGSVRQALSFKNRFYEESSFKWGKIFYRLMKYKQAEEKLKHQEFKCVDYYQTLGDVQDVLGKYDEAEKSYLKALIISSVEDQIYLHILVGDVRKKMGRLFKEKDSAKAAYQEAERLCSGKAFSEQGSKKSLLLAEIYLAFSALFKESGDFTKMKENLEKCKNSLSQNIEKCKDQLPHKYWSGEAVLLESLIQLDVYNNFDRAAELSEQATKMFSQLYQREDHPKRLECLDIEGSILLNGKDPLLGIRAKEKVIALRKKTFNEIHPSVADALNDLGTGWLKLGNYEEALEYKEEAFRLRKSLFDENHPTIAASKAELGAVYEKMGDLDKALALKIQALELRRKFFPKEHPDIADSLYGLGECYASKGDARQSFEYRMESLKMRKRLFGEKHSLVADSMDAVGSSHALLNEHEKALEWHHKALELRVAIFGDDHAVIASSWMSLGSAYDWKGDFAAALKYKNQALELIEKIFGKNHFLMVGCLLNLSCGHEKSGDRSRAEELKQEAHSLKLQILGENLRDIYEKDVQYEPLLKADRGIWRILPVTSNIVATASYDHQARLWVEKGQVRLLKKHSKEVLSLACIDDQEILTGSSDGTLHRHGINGDLLDELHDQAKPITGFYSMAFMGGSTVATGACHRPDRYSGNWNHVIKVWDIHKKKFLFDLRGHEGGVSALVKIDEERLASSSGDCSVRIWDFGKRSEVKKFSYHQEYVYGLAMFNNHQCISASKDKTIKLMDVISGQLIGSFRHGKAETAHISTVYDVNTAKNNLAVSASRDGYVKIWDRRTLGCVKVLDADGRYVFCTDFSKDGVRIFAGTNKEDGPDGRAELVSWDFRKA